MSPYIKGGSNLEKKADLTLCESEHMVRVQLGYHAIRSYQRKTVFTSEKCFHEQSLATETQTIHSS